MAKYELNAQRKTHAAHSQNDVTTYLSLFTESLTPLEEQSGELTSLGKKPCTASAVDAAYDVLIDRLLPTLAAHLKTLEGSNLGVEANRELASALNALLKKTGCALLCPHCQQAAYAIRYVRSGTAKNPVFKFDHHQGGTHGAKSYLSNLNLVRDPRKTE